MEKPNDSKEKLQQVATKLSQLFGPEAINKFFSQILEEAERRHNPTPKEPFKVSTDPSYYLTLLAEKMGWNERKLSNILNLISDLSPKMLVELILMEIAREMDKKYEGHISKQDRIWSVDFTDLTIILVRTHVDPKSPLYFNCFAAFRSEEDAKLAMAILEPFFINLEQGNSIGLRYVQD